MEKQIRYGVLGYARIAKEQLLPAMAEAGNARPYAVASQRGEEAGEAREKFGVEKVYDSYAKLLSDPDVDAVYIPLPNSLHKEWTIKAAKAGKHILCEKPMALSRKDCEDMKKASEDNKVKLMEAFTVPYTARVRELMKLLENKRVGEIKNINSSFRFHLENRPHDVRINPDLGGGALWDIGCYPIYLLGMIMGEAPESFCAQKVVKHGVDYSLSAVLKYRSGMICTVSCGFDSESTTFTEINGTDGSILIRDTFFDTQTPILVVSDGKTEEVGVPAGNRYTREVEDFSDAILNDRAPKVSLEDTLRNVELIEKILQSAK